MTVGWLTGVLSLVAAIGCRHRESSTRSSPPPGLPRQAQQLIGDGAWTWFNNPRAYFHNGRLYFGYVKASTARPALAVWSPGQAAATELFSIGALEKDDHDNPGITPTATGKLLVLSSRHGLERTIYSRLSSHADPACPADWNAERTDLLPASGGDRITYHNPFMLRSEGGRIFDFTRYLNFNPTIVTTDSDGATWNPPVHFIETGTGSDVRPYLQCASNYTDRIDLIYTDGHPSEVACSVYHTYYRSNASGTPGGGSFYRSDGTPLKRFANLPLKHDAPFLERGSVIYEYSSAPSRDPNDWIQHGRAWVWDLAYGGDGHPACVFQVQKDHVTGTGWSDDRIYYYYARWTGTAWQKRLIAQGGRGLYATQRDYGGGMTLDPVDPDVVYISSNAADPFALGDLTRVPLAAAGRYEIYRGVTRDGGLTFHWAPMTRNSARDNVRPYVPRNHALERALIWIRGTYHAYTDFETDVYGVFTQRGGGDQGGAVDELVDPAPPRVEQEVHGAPA